VKNVNIYLHCPDLLCDLLCLCASALSGQIFLFQILQRDGPLSLSIYTGTRKILSIFLSIFWFEKTITNLQKVSLFLGICIMGMELFDKGSSPPKQVKENTKTEKQDSFNSEVNDSDFTEDTKKNKKY
jgi:hypothetical protein